MAREASPALMTRIRSLASQLVSLEQALISHGDREAAETIKRARRELDVAIRQGLFASRGESV